MKQFYVFIDNRVVFENNLNVNINVTQLLLLFFFFWGGGGEGGDGAGIVGANPDTIIDYHDRALPNSFKRFRTLMSCDAAVPIFSCSVFFCVSEFFTGREMSGKRGSVEFAVKRYPRPVMLLKQCNNDRTL